MRPQPLSGITVIDLGQIYQAPYCTLLMALAGARVIKVEPLGGEPARRRADAPDGSVPLAMLNSNKEGVTLNLKDERGKEMLLKLVEKADVFVENFAPGVLDRLGVGSKVLRERNPSLIYAAASGFGRSGPYRDGLAMDITIQAIGGLMSVTGFPDGPPVKAGAAVVDFMGALHLYGGIVTALYERTRSGQGCVVDIAMQEALYPALASALGLLRANNGKAPPRTGNRHNGLSIAPYNSYEAKDGWVAVFCVTESHWVGITEAMGRPDLRADPRMATSASRAHIMEEVDGLVESWTRSLTKAELMELSRRHKFPASPVRELQEVIADPQMHARGMLQTINHPVLGDAVLPHSPILLEEFGRIPLKPSPGLGEHNASVYREYLGLSEEELEELLRQGVI